MAIKDWGLQSFWSLLRLWTIPIVILIFSLTAALNGKQVFKWFVAEDGFAENLEVIFFSLSAVCCSLNAKILRQKNMIIISNLYIITFVGLLFLIGEEISWGQRIFGWATPEKLSNINRQNETNIHNIYFLRHVFKWAQMLIGIYGTILPIFLIRLEFFKIRKEFFSFFIPHFTLIPYFIAFIPWRFYRNLFDPPEELYFFFCGFNEVLELILSIGIFLFMIFQYRRLKS